MDTIFEIKTDKKLRQAIHFYGILKSGYIFFQDSSKRNNKIVKHIFYNVLIINITICFKGKFPFIIVISH